MKNIKVMTILGTRPDIIKLSRVMAALDRHAQHILVHTGQNYDYELNEIFFKELNVRKPDYFLEVASGKVAQDIANIIARIDPILEKETPDAVLIYGDTNSALSVIPVKRRKIPIFHMEAGNRCFDARVPEEINRKIVDHLSDINMTLSEHARRYLLAEGLPADRVMKIGSCMKEIYQYYHQKINRAKILSTLKLKKQNYFVVSLHREDNVDSPANLKQLLSALTLVATQYKKPIIVSTHPRTRKRLEALKGYRKHPLVRFQKPFGFLDYVKLQQNAFCVISDSGSLTEESSILGFPAVMMRRMHERPEGMDEGAVVMAGLHAERLLQAIAVVTQPKKPMHVISDYDVDNVSQKVLRIILSYVDYVRENVWKEIV